MYVAVKAEIGVELPDETEDPHATAEHVIADAVAGIQTIKQLYVERRVLLVDQ